VHVLLAINLKAIVGIEPFFNTSLCLLRYLKPLTTPITIPSYELAWECICFRDYAYQATCINRQHRSVGDTKSNVQQHNGIVGEGNWNWKRGAETEVMQKMNAWWLINYGVSFCNRCILRRIICTFNHFHSALGIIKSNKAKDSGR